MGHIESNGEIKTFPELIRRYPRLRVSEYQYQCLKHVIPRGWKAALRVNRNRALTRNVDVPLTVAVGGTEIELRQMTCGAFYSTQLPKDAIPTCRRKWVAEHFHFSVAKWKEIYRLPYEISVSSLYNVE